MSHSGTGVIKVIDQLSITYLSRDPLSSGDLPNNFNGLVPVEQRGTTFREPASLPNAKFPIPIQFWDSVYEVYECDRSQMY